MNEIKQRLRSSRNWLGLIEELESEAEKLEERKDKAHRLYVIGQACEELFLRKDKAMVNYQKAFKLFPQDARPLVRARTIYHEMGNLRMVAKLLEFQLKVVTDPHERAELMLELGWIYIDISRREDAQGVFAEIQSIDGDLSGLADALATVGYETDAWADVIDGMLDQVRDATPEQGIELLIRAARICGLEAPEEGLREDLLRKALEIDPHHALANYLLETMLVDTGRTIEIVELHHARGDKVTEEQRAASYRAFASAWTTRFNDPPRSALFYNMALRSYYGNGSDHFPGHMAAFRFLREVEGTQDKNWKGLLELADEGLQAPLADEDLAVLAAEAGEIASKELEDIPLAAGYFDWVRKIDPNNPYLIDFVADHADAFESLEADVAAGAEPAVEEEISIEAGEPAPAEDEAPPTVEVEAVSVDAAPEDEATETATAENEAVSVDEAPEDEAPEDEAPGEVSDEETEQVVVTIPHEDAEAAQAAAEEDAPEEPAEDEAVSVDEAAEAESAQDESAQEDEAAQDEAVSEEEPEEEPLAAEEAAPPAPVPSEIDEEVDEASAVLFAAAAQAEAESREKGINEWRKANQKARQYRTPKRALARLYEAEERWNPLVEVLKDEVELISDPSEKIAILTQMSMIYRDRLNLDAMVVKTLSEIINVDPSRLEVMDDLAAQYEKMKRWTDLIATLKKKAEATGDADERVQIWSRIANLFMERFSNQAEAIKAYEQVIELDPTNVTAIEHLKSMYERRRDWDKLINIYKAEIDLLDDDDERARRYVEVAQLASKKLKRPQISMELWGKVLDYDAENLEALQELEPLYERAKDWDNLADVCERQVALMDDVPRQTQVLQKLGVLFTDKAKDEQRAINAWQGLLEIDPDNRRAQDSLKKLYLALKDFEALEAFYASQNKWDEFIRVLERQVESEDPDSRLELYFKIADLWQDKLEKPDRAVRAYEKALTLDDNNLRAAEALIPLYEGGRDVKKYVRVLEIQLANTEEDELKLERIRHLAELSEQKLRDNESAFSWYLQAFGVDCRGEWIREEAERLAGEVGKWPDLVEAYEQAYDKLMDPADQLPIMMTVARVYEEELANTDAALEANKGILEIESQSTEALGALERLYTKTAQWTELLEICQRKIDLVEDPDERKEIYFRIAYLYEEEIGEPEKAIDAYRTVLDLAGDDAQALKALNRIYEAQEMWSDLAETLMRELGLVTSEDTEELIAVKYRLGAIRETQLDDLVGAIDCYRDILDLQAEHEGAREALERHLTDENVQLDASRILEPIYTELNEWKKLINVHEIQLVREDDPLARVDLLLRIGALWVEKLGDGAQGFTAFSRCFKEEPTNEVAREELERLAAIQETWAELAALYEEATQEALDAPLQLELLMKLASILDERLEQPERSVEFYRKAQDLEPDNTPVLDALEKLYTRGEQWAELLEIYRRKADLSTDADEREGLFFRMAYIWEEMLSNLEEATGTYKEVLAQDDTNEKALKALDRLFQVQGAWHELADNLSRQLSLAEETSTTIDLSLRLASLRETELSETAAAVDTYRQVLELEPSNDQAVAALERLIENEEHQLAVAQILEPIYKTADDWQKLVGVFEIMVSHSYDPVQKLELYHRIGELYEIAGDDSRGAFAVYGRALHEEASDEESQNRIERLARELEAWEDLVALYNELVADVMDEVLAITLHMKVASFYETNLMNYDEAAAAYNRILAIDPQNLDAVNALEQIYIRQESHELLVSVILKKADIILEAQDRKGLFFRAAQIYEDVLEDMEEAIKVYQLVLDMDDADTTAIEALERLYFRLERWDSLKEIFSRKVELAEEVDDKKAIYYRLGALYEEQLTDIERAIETFQSVLDLDPDDLMAIRSLDRLYQQAERWYDLLQALERQVELAGPSPDAVDLKYRIGKLWELELGDLTRAVETYREVLITDPSHETTLAALDAIVHGEDEPVIAAQVLEPIYEQIFEWEKLIDLYEVMVKHVDDPFRKLELLHKIAELYEQRLEDSGNAFEAYSRALREENADEQSLAHLERLADYINGFEPLAQLYEEELEKMLDPQRQVEMGLRVARVYEEELQRPADAINKYKQVLDVEPDDQNAILALDRLYMEGEHWTELAEILRLEIRMADAEDQIVNLQFRLGQLYQEMLGDLNNAIECYRDILAATPEHSPSITSLELLIEDGQQQSEIAEILEPLYRMSEQWEKLVKIMTIQLERMDDPMDKVQAVQRIAEICEQRLGDHSRAFEWWAHAYGHDPQSELVAEELERLARIVDGWEALVNTYRAVLEALEPDDQKRVLMAMARVCEEEILDRARAEEAFLQVLQIDDMDPDALAALDRIYDQTGMFQELAEILKRRITITDSTDDLVELQLRLGATFEGPLEDDDSAIEAYNNVLDGDSRNAQALDALEKLYYKQEKWQELFETYEKMVDIAPGDAGVADAYARMAKISSDALDDADQAQDLWNRVLDLRGEDPVALWALADLYEAAEEWRDLVEVLQRQVHITEDPPAQVRLYQRLGRIWGEKLGRDRNALESWQKVLEIEPGNLTALYAISEIYRNTQAWEELVETLHRLIEIGITSDMEDDSLKSLYTQLGELQGEILLRPQESIDAWRKVIDLQADDFRALGALEQLLTQEARWEECIQVLERKVAVLDGGEEKIDVLMQAANIWQEKVGNNESAARVYEQIMGLDAANRIAYTALDELYREGWHWEKLIELLLGRATEHAESIEEAVELLQDVATTYEEKMSQPDAAFEVCRAAFQQDYTNDITAKNLERLAHTTGKWNELLTDYGQVVQAVTEPKVKADLHVKMGRWYGNELGRMDYAVASLNQALQLDPECVKAYDALAEFYRKTARWAELVQILDRQAQLEEEPEKKVELYANMAELYENQIADPNQGIAAYRKVLDVDEINADALDNLERLYRSFQQWEPLIEILERKAENTEEYEQIIDLKGSIGELYDDRLEDSAKAITSYKDILTIEPHHLSTMKSLEALYEKTGQMEDYIDILEQQLDVVDSDEARVSIYQRMAAVNEEQFQKLDQASECLEKILEIDPSSEATYRSLERIYRQDNRFDELVDVYARHINAITDIHERIELYMQMGQIYEQSLQDPDRAVEAFTDILSFDADHVHALDALARLYEQIESWDRAVDVMNRVVNLVDDASYRVSVFFRLGKITEEQIGDSEEAENHYQQALAIDPAHVDSMMRLVEIYKLRGDWAKAASMMVRAEAHTTNPLEKARLLYEAGAAYLQQLDEEGKAVDLFARTLEVDPDHQQSGEPLAQIYFRDGRYEELEPVLDMLVRKADRRDNRLLQDLYFKLAKTSDELGKADKALKYYRAAYDIDSTHLATLTGMAALLYRTEDWDRAFKIYQTILVHHRDSQRADEIVDIFYRLGNIKLMLGERKKALNMFEKALEIDASHRETLESVIALQTKANDFEAVVNAKRALLDVVTEEERFRMLDECGDIYREKLNNTEKAIAFYTDALGMETGSHVVLHKLLELYTETKQWKKAVEIVVQLTEIEKDPGLKSKYFYTAAVIYRDEVRALDEAIDFYNQALDNSPDLLKAFEAIDRLCTQKKDWKALERNYRKMLKRLPKDGATELQIMLWHNLGEIYRTRLKDFKSATAAFEVAVGLDPDNMTRHEILAELYIVAGPEYSQKAVSEHQTLIKSSPFKIESYKALRKIYMDTRQYDKAWCLCSTLSFLKKADPEEQQFYEQYKQRGFVRAKARMTDELWHRHVFHPEEDRYIGHILAICAPVVGQLTARPHKGFGLKRKEKRDLATDQLLFSKVFNYVTSVLNVVPAELYLRPNQQTGLMMAHTKEIPSFVVGADLLQGRPEKELAFAIAKQLSYLRPEHFLRRVLTAPSQLKTVFFAALRLANPKFPVPPSDIPEVDKILKQVSGRLHAGQLEQLAVVVRKFAESQAEVNLNKWWTTTELTANRVGFVLCNDLEVASKMVSTEPAEIGSLPPKEKVKELVLYSVSEEYFNVRGQLGLSIGQ
jgi:tetratricopeptide (TPR) repeat protein